MSANAIDKHHRYYIQFKRHNLAWLTGSPCMASPVLLLPDNQLGMETQQSLPETVPHPSPEAHQETEVIESQEATAAVPVPTGAPSDSVEQAVAAQEAAEAMAAAPSTLAPLPQVDGRAVASPATNDGKGVESMSWEQLEQVRNQKHYCSRCKEPVTCTSTTAVRKKRHSALQCQQCHNTVTLMYKRWDMSKINFKELPEAEQVEFFRAAKQTGGKRLEFGKIKSLLLKKLIEVEKNSTETAVKGKYLPLSVWEKKGFDVGAIQKGAEQQKSDLFGVVYRVPILEINYSHIEESVRETLLQAERRVKPSKRILDCISIHCFVFLAKKTMIAMILT